MSVASARNYLEELHIAFLEKHFYLYQSNSIAGPDMLSPHHSFEHKSKAYYLSSEGKPLEGTGWFIPEIQYKDYQSKTSNDLYWIFIAYVPSMPLKEFLDQNGLVTEEYILHRDVFFADWHVCKDLPVGKAIEGSKRGPGRNIDVIYLKKNLDFRVYKLPKAKIFMQKDKDLEYLFKSGKKKSTKYPVWF